MTLRPILVLFTVLCVVSVAGVAKAEAWGRFAVNADLPSGFAMGPPPENDDGRSFIDGKGAEIRIWGSHALRPLDEDEAATRDFYETLGGEVTFRAGGENWYVLSGFLGQEVFYTRIENGETCSGDPARAGLQMLYPVTEREQYDGMIEALSGSLGFGCDG